jgi:hypothetical protein
VHKILRATDNVKSLVGGFGVNKVVIATHSEKLL